MAQLRLTCFQSFSANLDHKPLLFRSAKGRALLAYLAVEQTAHQRSTLAGLLWPDESESRARKNLSQTLLEVRKAIGDADAAPPFLQVTPQTIAFNPQSPHQIDLLDFEQAIQRQDFAQAVALYTGPFLDDFQMPESDLFEAWGFSVRERAQQQAIDALIKLSQQLEVQHQFDDAIQHVRRLLELAPWQEEVHRQLMRLLAISGQRSAALAQYDTLTQMLMDELGVPPAAETDALYDQILVGEVEPRAADGGATTNRIALANHPQSPFQALAPPPHFVGRQGEIARLRTQMSAPGLQIHAVVGMGGVGKTALVAQLANAVRSDFPDGVLWGNPAISSPLDILATWSSAYGYDFSQMHDVESRAAAVRGVLADKKTLVVVDNVDHLADIQPLLPNGDGCAVLLTTRDRDVAHALNAEAMLLGELAEESAFELVEEILGEERVQTQADAAREICRLLSNLPLAVELAAQRLKSRPRMRLDQMAARLGDQQQRMKLGISDRAVRSSFEVSWDGLDESLRQLFPLLAIFEGRSFTAVVVAYLAEAELFDVEDALYALSALSLVRPEGDGQAGNGQAGEERWWQHPLLADFAQEKLVGKEAAYNRFSDYFYGLAQESSTHFERLEPEWENIMAGMQGAFEQARWPLVVAYGDALTEPWQKRARYSDARYGFSLVGKAAVAVNNSEAQAANRLRWGAACLHQSAFDEATMHLTKSLAYYDEVQDGAATASVQEQLALIAIELNEYDQAIVLLDQVLALRQELDEPAGIGSVYFQQARIQYDKAEWELAQASAEKALAIQTTAADTTGQVRSARLLAQIWLVKNEYDQALSYGLQAKELSEESNETSELAITLYTLTAIYQRRQQYDQAEKTANRSLALLRRSGDQRVEALLLYQMSEMQTDLENFAAALELSMASVTVFRQLKDRVTLAFALLRLGDIYQRMGDNNAAQAAWTETRELAVGLDHELLLQLVEERGVRN